MNKRNEIIMKWVFLAAACSSIAIVATICAFIFANGVPAINTIGVPEFFFGQRWRPNNEIFGILPMITGSIYVTAIAILIGVPIGVFSAMFLFAFCHEQLYAYLKPLVELLAGIPSVIYGFFGLVVIVPLVREHLGGNGSSMLTAGLLLGMMILPTIISVAEAALRAVPISYYEGALALGAGHVRSCFFAVMPAAKSGIMAAIILGLGRAVGETMAVIMVAGNQARMPDGLLEGVRTMTANIVIEMGYAADLHRDALIATGVVLFVFILIINLLFYYLKGKVVQQ